MTKKAKTEQSHNNAELEEMKESLQRLQAEFDNFRKRNEKDKANFVNLATEHLIKKLIPILDNFDLALSNHKETEFSEGIQMIYKQLKEVLEEEGLQKIETNIPFNPAMHEAVLTEEGEQPNKITQVLQDGYKINEKIIRPTKVKIIRGGEKK